MAVVSVDIPDSIANKFSKGVINYTFFIKKITGLDIDEDEGWVDIDVNMNAKDFLNTLKKELL